MQLTGLTVNNSINSYEGTEPAFSVVLFPQVPAKSSPCFYVENGQKLSVGTFFINSTSRQIKIIIFLSMRIFLGFYFTSFR